MQRDIFMQKKEDTYYLNDGFFYIAKMVKKQTENYEEGHILSGCLHRWLLSI